MTEDVNTSQEEALQRHRARTSTPQCRRYTTRCHVGTNSEVTTTTDSGTGLQLNASTTIIFSVCRFLAFLRHELSYKSCGDGRVAIITENFIEIPSTTFQVILITDSVQLCIQRKTSTFVGEAAGNAQTGLYSSHNFTGII